MSQPTNRSPAYSDLIAACHDEGCPICRLSRRATDRYIDSMLNDVVAAADVELRFVASRGLCPWHASQMADRSDRVLSSARLHRAVIENVLSSIKGESEIIDHALRRKWPGSERQKFLAAMLNPHRECPACEQQAASEHMILSELGKHLLEQDFIEVFEASAGLCLPHFRQALPLIRDEASAYRLIELQRGVYQRVRDQLVGLMRQNHDQFGDRSIGRNAIEIISGAR